MSFNWKNKLAILILNIFIFIGNKSNILKSNENNITDIHVSTTQIYQMLTFCYTGFRVLLFVLKRKKRDS